MDKLLLRPAEVGEMIGVSRAQAYVLIQKGIIPSVRIGASVRVPLDSLQAYIKQLTAESAGEAVSA
jgi:excisionase family DNA binding protein